MIYRAMGLNYTSAKPQLHRAQIQHVSEVCGGSYLQWQKAVFERLTQCQMSPTTSKHIINDCSSNKESFVCMSLRLSLL